MNNTEAVIFDLDNTILDRTRTFSRFTHTLIGTYFGHIERTQPIYDTIILLDQDGYKDKSELFAELIAELPWQETPEVAELLEFYEKEYIHNAVLMHRAREVIAHVRAKYRTGLVTNGKTSIQYGKIDRLGIRNEFDVIIVSEEAGVKKPDRKIFEMALLKLRLPPEACIFVGDHPIKDIEGAARAGMETIWVKVNQPWQEGLAAKPRHTIHQLEELLELL